MHCLSSGPSSGRQCACPCYQTLRGTAMQKWLPRLKLPIFLSTLLPSTVTTVLFGWLQPFYKTLAGVHELAL